MTATTTTEPLMVCRETFVSAGFGLVRRGERIRASDPVAREYPRHFVDASLPEREWGSLTLELESQRGLEQREAEARAFAEEAARNRLKLEADPVPVIMVCIRDFVTRQLGTPCTVVKGSTALATDAVVTHHPDAWKRR
jgi:hypothetical protein